MSRSRNNTIVKPLPCPFCGGKAVVQKCTDHGPELPKLFYSVDCDHKNVCTAWPTALGDTRTEAIQRWNVRVGGYGDLTHRLETMPSTWYPAIFKQIVVACKRKGVFAQPHGMSNFCRKFEGKVQS